MKGRYLKDCFPLLSLQINLSEFDARTDNYLTTKRRLDWGKKTNIHRMNWKKPESLMTSLSSNLNNPISTCLVCDIIKFSFPSNYLSWGLLLFVLLCFQSVTIAKVPSVVLITINMSVLIFMKINKAGHNFIQLQ